MTSDNDKVVWLHPRYIREASKLLDVLPREDQVNIVKLFWSVFLTEVRDSLEGKEEPGPFFKMVNKFYKEAGYGPGHSPNCYMCDHDIDGNAEEFNLDSHLCLFCMVKLANVLTAFDIDHRSLFPKMGERTVQKTRFKKAYATCDGCGLEMAPGGGCAIETIEYPDGEKLARIPYGAEARFGERFRDFIDSSKPCRICNVADSKFHHVGCNWEECPRCGEQLLSCNCPVKGG